MGGNISQTAGSGTADMNAPPIVPAAAESIDSGAANPVDSDVSANQATP
jgi:hypothetical protein